MNAYLTKIIEDTRTTMVKHTPEIALGAGIALGVSTVILAVRETPKAMMLIEERKLDLQTDTLSKIETVKIAGPCYIPALVTGGLSIVCLIGGNTVQAHRNAAITTAYALTNASLKEYRKKVVETIGEKKELAIHDAIAQEKVEKNPANEHKIIVTGKGETLCYEPYCGHYFRSDVDNIKRAVNDLNARMLKDGYISLNDFYSEVGIDDIDDPLLGNEFGWRYENGLIDIHISAQVSSLNEPCLVINLVTPPVYEYDKWL